MDVIDGTVERTRFRNDDNGWTVLQVSVAERDGPTVVVGLLPCAVEDGVNFTARGTWQESKYGLQFRAETLTPLPPTTAEQVIRRLQTYPRIGEAMAKRIYAKFGDETWDVMDSAIGSLRQVRGIGASALDQIMRHHERQHGPVAKIQARLIELAVSAKLAKRIFGVFGADALEIINQHPWRVSAKVKGFGFDTAEKIASRAGLDLSSTERVDAGILHTLKDAMGREGHCALPEAELVDRSLRLLKLTRGAVEDGVQRLLKGERPPLAYQSMDDESPGLVFTRGMDWVEGAIAHQIGMLSTTLRPALNVGELPDWLSEGQVEAVQAVASSGFVVLTGGPGTGKSTVQDVVVKMAARNDLDVILCAPTGRAAKRLAETTGLEAKTIHRLLGVQPGVDGFTHHRNNPLPEGLLIVDESSMVDARLCESLFQALTDKNRVLLVGDADQLPSVGAGNVLRDIIAAADELSAVTVVRLQKVHRQAEGSTIIRNAHRMLVGDSLEPDPPSRGAEGEFFFLPRSSTGAVHQTIVDLASNRIPKAYGLDRMTEVQILSPMNPTHAGVKALNRTLQRLYTAGGHGFSIGKDANEKRFNIGDRIMNTKNDYDRGVFNGDIGTVVRFGRNADGDTMIVDYDGTAAEYLRRDLGPLRLAYAITIHKSQGSEFPAVIIPMVTEHRVMLRRNLLYTAATRAKRLCVIVGRPEAVRMAIETADADKRWTGLKRRVVEALGNASARRGLAAS